MPIWDEDSGKKGSWVYRNSVEEFFCGGYDRFTKARYALVTAFALGTAIPYGWAGIYLMTGFQIAGQPDDVMTRPQLPVYPKAASDCGITANGYAVKAFGPACTDEVVESVISMDFKYERERAVYTIMMPHLNLVADVRFLFSKP